MNDLLSEMISYIEYMEVKVDDEWGFCRSLKKLIKDGDMPKLYHHLKQLSGGGIKYEYR